MFISKSNKQYKPHFITLIVVAFFTVCFFIVLCCVAVYHLFDDNYNSDIRNILALLLGIVSSVYFTHFGWVRGIRELKTGLNKYEFMEDGFTVTEFKKQKSYQIADIEYYEHIWQDEIYRTIYSDAIKIYIYNQKDPYIFYKDYHLNYKQIEEWIEIHNICNKYAEGTTNGNKKQKKLDV